jgi:hypothetical protein
MSQYVETIGGIFLGTWSTHARVGKKAIEKVIEAIMATTKAFLDRSFIFSHLLPF